jgi:hypothetical protein
VIISQFYVLVSSGSSGSQSYSSFRMYITNLEAVALELRIRCVATIPGINMDLSSLLNERSNVTMNREALTVTWSRNGYLYTGEFSMKIRPLEILDPALAYSHLIPEIAATTDELKAVFNVSRLMGHWEVALPMKTVKRGGKTIQVPQLKRLARCLISAEASYGWYNLDIPMNDSYVVSATLAQGKAEHWLQPDGIS